MLKINPGLTFKISGPDLQKISQPTIVVFKLAKHYNFNILPIVLEGGHQAMPRGAGKRIIISILRFLCCNLSKLIRINQKKN